MQGYQQATQEGRNRFLQWLGANYGGIADSIRDIACIFRPETCQGGGSGQPTVVVQEDGSVKIYFLILGALILLLLVVILLKR